MAETLRDYRSKASDWYKELSPRVRVAIIAGIVVALIIIALLVNFMTNKTYIALVRGVSETKAAEITTKLDELNIAWKSEANATTILVEEKNIDKARMQLAMANITTDKGFTFEDVMDKLSFTQTTEEKNKMFLYQTKSELEDALKTLSQIEDANVIINVKANTSFLNLEKDVSSASVKLTLVEDETLSDDSVKGVENFVLTAIKGLTPETITIIDQNGVQLNADDGNSADAETTRRNKHQAEIQASIDSSIETLLTRIYGADNVSVATHVVLDFDSEETSIKKISPPVDGEVKGMIRSSNVLKESVKAGGSGGVAGTDSNTTDTPQYPTLRNGESDYTKLQEIYNYEMNEIQQSIVKSPGKIVDMSIAIIINSDILESGSLSEIDKQAIIEMVLSAAGVRDASKVSVSAWPFHVEAVVPVEVEDTNTILGIPIYIVALLVGAVLILIVLVFFLLRKRRTAVIQETQEIIEEQQELAEIDTEFQDRSSPKFQIEKFIDSNPEAVAQLLRSWMNEE